MNNVINLDDERNLISIKQKLSEIYIDNKIKLYESHGRISELSDDEYYYKYYPKKKMSGCVYFWDRDSFFGIPIGNLRVGISYEFDNNGKFEGQFISLEGHGKLRLFNEKEFREEWKKNIKFDEKYLEQLINEKRSDDNDEDYEI